MSSDEIWQIICFFSLCLNGYFYYQMLLPVFQKQTTVFMKDKIKTVMEEGELKGCIKSSERKLVENVLDFKERTAEDVMIHRRDVTMISLDETHESIIKKIQTTGLSRYPVYDHNADDVVGILATRKYLLNYLSQSKKSIKELIYPAYFIPKTVGAESLLRDMQSRKTHLSIVVDEYGGVDGIVTLEDLLEEIVGNIYDEFDPLAKQQIILLSDNLWQVAGSADLKEVAESIGFTLPQEELDFGTMAGMIFHELDIIPQDGSLPSIEMFGLHIQVESMIGSRIQWVRLSLLPPSQEENPSAAS